MEVENGCGHPMRMGKRDGHGSPPSSLYTNLCCDVLMHLQLQTRHLYGAKDVFVASPIWITNKSVGANESFVKCFVHAHMSVQMIANTIKEICLSKQVERTLVGIPCLLFTTTGMLFNDAPSRAIGLTTYRDSRTHETMIAELGSCVGLR